MTWRIGHSSFHVISSKLYKQKNIWFYPSTTWELLAMKVPKNILDSSWIHCEFKRNFGAHPLFVAMVSGHFFFVSRGRFLEMTCNSFHSLCVLICWCYAWFVPYAWTLMRTKSRLDIENQIIYDVIMSHCVFF